MPFVDMVAELNWISYSRPSGLHVRHLYSRCFLGSFQSGWLGGKRQNSQPPSDLAKLG